MKEQRQHQNIDGQKKCIGYDDEEYDKVARFNNQAKTPHQENNLKQ